MLWVLLLTLVAAISAWAEPAENAEFEAKIAALPKPKEVVSRDVSGWRQVNGKENSAFAVVDVQGMPFNKAIQIESKKRVDRDYMIQFGRPNIETVKPGDVLMLTFYARAIRPIAETDAGQVNATLFTTEEPRDGAGKSEILIDTQWKKYYAVWPVLMKRHPEPAKAGKMMLMLNMGLPPQVVQVADLHVLSFPAGVSAKDLPQKPNTYEGREANAAWRAPAADRIEKYRKGDLSVQVVDAVGKPVSNAEVHVAMKKHAFGFGSAVSDPRIVNMKGADCERYREEIVKLFNVVTLESGLKWEVFLGDRETPIKAIEWLRERGIKVRGHNLVWPQWNRMTFLDDATQAKIHSSPAALQQFILAHIRDELTPLAGKCFQWDVVNEPMSHKDFINFQGPQAIVEWFNLAHQIDPKAELLINDIRLHMPKGGPGGSAIPPEDDFYYYLKYLKDHGAPLAGIGIESHLAKMTPPDEFYAQLERYAEFGSLNITEFDDTVDDEQLQADMTRDYMTICFSHPKMENFISWGFWDGQHWRKNAPIFRKDWSLKPSGQVYKDLVFKQWWTDQKAATDAAGSAKVRGFLGDYEISVTSGGKTVTQPAKLTRDGAAISIAIK